jgi:hypothetical protein
MTQDVPIPQFPPEMFGPSPMEVATAVVVVVATIGSVVIAWTLVRALLRKWSTPPAADQTALQDLRQEVRQLAAEVSELQERLDFAERVLASKSEPDRIERKGT